MDYKEKYEQALEVAQRFYNNSAAITKKGLEDIFPELSESEDERIRKEIIAHIKWCEDSGYCSKEEMTRWITFLEKQGEHDAITFNDAHIIDSALNDYCCKQYSALHKENGGVLSFARLQHLAMDIYGWCKKQGEQKPTDLALYNDLKPWEKPEYIIKAINRKRVEPALKGYALHKFKNELNSLKQILHLLYDSYDNPVNYRLALHWASWGAQNLQGYFGISKEEREKMDDVTGEQKPVIEMKSAEESLGINSKEYNKIVDECIYGDDNSAWSEEDESHIRYLIECLEYCKKGVALTMTTSTAQEYINWLKSLKNRFGCEVNCTTTKEWSEEDEQTFIKSVEALEDFGKFELADWLKEHKNQCLTPQNTWKPSDEQMDALESAIVDSISSIQKHSLESLYNKLKKLF